jgi:tetratricopeptide (TPR) repeat protein
VVLPLSTVLLPLTVVFAQAASGSWSSVRPPECADVGGRAASVWERAKAPELRRYCDLVASASSKLAGTAAMAKAALEAAREADRVLPGHAAPRVLEGRALAALGKLDDALVALGEGASRDPRALDDPLALAAWARLLARTAHADRATEAYRALLPRASALSSADRASAAVEAGLVALARGAMGLDDATAALRQGVRDAQDDVQAVAVLALGLALDRRGDGAEARVLLADRSHGDPRATLTTPRAKDLLAVAPGEEPALAAMALEMSDPAGAREAWGQYVDATPAGPWAAHARVHLAGLARRGPARKVR